MATEDIIRNRLIEKILTIRNKDFLLALENLISSGSPDTGSAELSREQELMLQMSEEDIANGRLAPQDEVRSRTEEWLKSKKV